MFWWAGLCFALLALTLGGMRVTQYTFLLTVSHYFTDHLVVITYQDTQQCTNKRQGRRRLIVCVNNAGFSDTFRFWIKKKSALKIELEGSSVEIVVWHKILSTRSINWKFSRATSLGYLEIVIALYFLNETLDWGEKKGRMMMMKIVLSCSPRIHTKKNINVHLKLHRVTIMSLLSHSGILFNIVICCLSILLNQISLWMIPEIF